MLGEVIARKFLTKIGVGAMAALRATGIESLAVDQVAPPNAEMSRAGRRFFIGNTGATGVIPVTAVPTTACQWVIYNPTNSQRSIFIEQLGLVMSAGTPAAGGVTLYAAFIRAPLALTSAQFANLIVQSASDSRGLQSVAVIKSAITASDPALPGWAPIAELVSANVAAFPGANGLVDPNIGGALCIPPGSGLALAAVGPVGTAAAYLPRARWVEYECDLE